MNILQSWLIVGVPVLVLVGGMFAGHVAYRAQIGYVLLAALLVWFVLVPGDVISAAIVGLIGVGLIATGRGTAKDAAVPEHHENRKRFTTAHES